MTKAELEHLGIKVPKKLNKKIAAAIDRGDYASKSDLVRTAIRAQLDHDKES